MEATQDDIDRSAYEIAFWVEKRSETTALIIRGNGIKYAAIALTAGFMALHENRVYSAEAAQDFMLGMTELRWLTQEVTVACWKCKGEQEVVSYGSGGGFAGGTIYCTIYWTDLACGHVNMDESEDVAAAR